MMERISGLRNENAKENRSIITIGIQNQSNVAFPKARPLYGGEEREGMGALFADFWKILLLLVEMLLMVQVQQLDLALEKSNIGDFLPSAVNSTSRSVPIVQFSRLSPFKIWY
jgi:hypothetical protein